MRTVVARRVLIFLLLMSAGVAAAQVPSSNHVFVIIEENHSYSKVVGNTSDMPYLNSLISKYGLATQFYGNNVGSIPDYFMATSGQALDTWSVQNINNIVRELLAINKTWKSYAESLPQTGYTGGASYPYTREHNPFALFSDVVNSSTQVNNLVPFSPNFASDLANNSLPNYSFIIPNQQNNAHDCPAGMSTCTDSQKLQNADQWLKNHIDPLVQSALFQRDGMLIIEFDEAVGDTTNGGGHVEWAVIGPQVKPGYRSSFYYYANESTLRLTCEALGIALSSCPNAGASAPSMAEFFGATGTIAGNVVDNATHSPIAGATVSYSGGTTKTASDGTYTLNNVSTGSVTVTASASGYNSSSATLSVTSGGSTTQNFFLTSSGTAPGTISGKVVDISSGIGISAATVKYSGGSTTTDGSGNFSFTNVAAATYNVSASASGYFTETNSVVVTSGATATTTIQLPTGGILAGTVTGTGGAALAGATVSLSGGKAATTKTVTTNSSGAYNTSWVPVGTYSVTVSASGYSTQTKSTTVNTGATTTLNFSLAAAGTTGSASIAGRVTDISSGGAVGGATVSFGSNSTTADAGGNYTFAGVPPGSYSVTAVASGYFSRTQPVTTTAGTASTLNFQLATGGKVAGTVTNTSGAAIAGASVAITGGSIATTVNTSTTSTGVYNSSWVPVGSYTVTVSASGFTTQSKTVNVTTGSTATLNFTLQ